jgi:hypothetical protein
METEVVVSRKVVSQWSFNGLISHRSASEHDEYDGRVSELTPPSFC